MLFQKIAVSLQNQIYYTRIANYLSKTLIIMEEIEKAFKKFVYTGVGLLSTSADKLKGAVENLVSDDKISKDEGERIVDDFFNETETRKEEYETKIKAIVKKLTEKLKIAKNEEVEALTKRSQELEKAVAEKLNK